GGRKEDGQLVVVHLVHSSGKCALEAPEVDLAVAVGPIAIGILRANAAGGLPQAVEELTPTRVGVQIKVSGLYSRARSLVHRIVARGCRGTRGRRHYECEADQ